MYNTTKLLTLYCEVNNYKIYETCINNYINNIFQVFVHNVSLDI